MATHLDDLRLANERIAELEQEVALLRVQAETIKVAKNRAEVALRKKIMLKARRLCTPAELRTVYACVLIENPEEMEPLSEADMTWALTVAERWGKEKHEG